MARKTHYPSPSEEKHVEQVREIIRKSRKLLEISQPDTFLARRTHEPFPSEQGDDAQDGQRRKPA